MSSIWSFLNMKGGVSKSTSTLNIGVELAESYGLKVLLVDNDPQASLTIALGVEPAGLDKTIADVLTTYNQKDSVYMEDVMLNVREGLFLIPSTIDLSGADLSLQSVILGREKILGKTLKPLLSKYEFDIVLIDNQPSLSLLPLNSLVCSDYLLIPCSTEYLSYRGLHLIEETVDRVKEDLNPALKMFGIIASRHKSRNLHNKEVLDLLRSNWNVIGVIPESTKVPDAVYHDSGAVVLSDPHSKPAAEYKKITKCIYNEIKKGMVKDEQKEWFE